MSFHKKACVCNPEELARMCDDELLVLKGMMNGRLYLYCCGHGSSGNRSLLSISGLKQALLPFHPGILHTHSTPYKHHDAPLI